MPKTVNEQFRDILVRRQIALAHFEHTLTSDVVDLLDKTEKELRTELLDRLEKITGRDVAGSTTTSRINVLANAISKIRATAYDEAGSVWDEHLTELANAEAAYLDAHLKDISPVQLDTILPDPVQLAAIVSVQPIQGRVFADWAQGAQEMDVQRITDAVRMGVTQGEDTGDIIRRVVGSQAIDGTDGVTQMARNDIASLTQTAISTVSNEARQAYFEENSDLFSKEQWVATLDDATCEECGDLDGELFDISDGDQPPIHFNCRCVRVPVIDGNSLGDRPANAAYADELDGLDPEERLARVKELVGQVPSSTTYSEWLTEQSAAFQEHVLGPTRADLFRNGGLKLGRFVNARGDRYNLDQLREMEPSAFRKAGL